MRRELVSLTAGAIVVIVIARLIVRITTPLIPYLIVLGVLLLIGDHFIRRRRRW